MFHVFAKESLELSLAIRLCGVEGVPAGRAISAADVQPPVEQLGALGHEVPGTRAH